MFQSEKCFLLSKHAVGPIKLMSYLGLPAECDVLMFEFFVGAHIGRKKPTRGSVSLNLLSVLLKERP